MEHTTFVIDASVGIKLLLPEPLSDRAESLFGLLGKRPAVRFFVPDMFYVECANVLWKRITRYGYKLSAAIADLRNLRALALRIVATSDLTETALKLSALHGITVYDACYVALSDLADAPLITADERLVRKLADKKHRVQWLGNHAAHST